VVGGNRGRPEAQGAMESESQKVEVKRFHRQFLLTVRVRGQTHQHLCSEHLYIDF